MWQWMTSRTTSVTTSGRSRWSRKYNRHWIMTSTILKRLISSSVRMTRLKEQASTNSNSIRPSTVYSLVGSTSQTYSGSGSNWNYKTNNNWLMNSSCWHLDIRHSWIDQPLPLVITHNLSSVIEMMCWRVNV